MRSRGFWFLKRIEWFIRGSEKYTRILWKAGSSWGGNTLFLGKPEVVIHHFHTKNLDFLLLFPCPAVLFFYLSTEAMTSSLISDLTASFKPAALYFLHKCHKWAYSTSHYPAHQVKGSLLPIYDWFSRPQEKLQVPISGLMSFIFQVFFKIESNN